MSDLVENPEERVLLDTPCIKGDQILMPYHHMMHNFHLGDFTFSIPYDRSSKKFKRGQKENATFSHSGCSKL